MQLSSVLVERIGAACVGAACAIVASYLLKARTPAQLPAPLEGALTYTHMYVGTDGLTHLRRGCRFGSLQKKGYAGTPQYVRNFASDFKVKSMVVTQQFAENPWHHCPAPQFVVTTGGRWYIRTGDGDRIEFQAGDVLYQDNDPNHPMAKAGTLNAMHYSGAIGPCNRELSRSQFAIYSWLARSDWRQLKGACAIPV